MPPTEEDLPQEVPFIDVRTEAPVPNVRLFVGPIPMVAIDEGDMPRSLWIAVALDLVDGRAAGLGLYDAPPSDECVLSLLDQGTVGHGPLGTLWSCTCAAVTTDWALLWSTPERLAWLTRRGIRLHAAVPAGPAADEVAQRAFGRTTASLCKFMKRRRHARAADRRALLTLQAAAEAAREWRDACDVAEAGVPAG
jgi:hypothetical protein